VPIHQSLKMINSLIVTLMAILEDVFRNALKKKYGSDDNFDIINLIREIWKFGEEELLLRTKI
jgi:hypothetical protein